LISSTDVEKVFNNIQHLFLIKALRNLGIEGMYFNTIKATYKFIKELNIRTKTLKILEEKAGNTLETIDIGKDFLCRT
jgi:hypothetical protein